MFFGFGFEEVLANSKQPSHPSLASSSWESVDGGVTGWLALSCPVLLLPARIENFSPILFPSVAKMKFGGMDFLSDVEAKPCAICTKKVPTADKVVADRRTSE
jgi:hypothetical protein